MISTFKVCSWVCSVTGYLPRFPGLHGARQFERFRVLAWLPVGVQRVTGCQVPPGPLARAIPAVRSWIAATIRRSSQAASWAIFHIAFAHPSVRCRTDATFFIFLLQCDPIVKPQRRIAAPSQPAFGTEQRLSTGCDSIFASREAAQRSATKSEQLVASAFGPALSTRVSSTQMLRTPRPTAWAWHRAARGPMGLRKADHQAIGLSFIGLSALMRSVTVAGPACTAATARDHQSDLATFAFVLTASKCAFASSLHAFCASPSSAWHFAKAICVSPSA